MAHDGEARVADLGFDPGALREKYRAERDKRLRADGNAQYVKIDGEFVQHATSGHIDQLVIEAVVRSRPATAKGRFIETCTLSSTFSPGIRVDLSPFLTA